MSAPPQRPPGLMEQMAARSLRAFCRCTARRELRVCAEGLERLPPQGPVVIAARHYHHLYDAVALLTAIPRQVHILVALDWVRGRRGRAIMEWACRTARWPFVLRADSPHLRSGASSYRAEEALAISRRAVRDATRLLQEGRVLLVFPEGYPVVDPEGGRGGEVLPFRPGFARLAAHAQRLIGGPVPVVPAGLAYRSGRRWEAVLRFGEPAFVGPRVDLPAFVRRIEAEVRALSADQAGAAPAHAVHAAPPAAAS